MRFLKHKIQRLYYEIRNFEPVWKFLNRNAIGEWKKENAQLDDEQKRISTELQKNGIAFSSIEKLGFSDLFFELKKFTENRLQTPEIINEIESKKICKKAKKEKRPFLFICSEATKIWANWTPKTRLYGFL